MTPGIDAVCQLPFNKYSHIAVIKMIAEGLRSIGELTTYLELGVAKGSCFNEVAPLAKIAYAVDLRKKTHRYIRKNKNLNWNCCSVTEFLDGYTGDSFDLVFLDADHAFESSWSDFQKVAPLVKPNGIILLHDTYPPNKACSQPDVSGDTWKTAWKIRQEMSNEYEIVTLPFYFGVSIVRKCRTQLLWEGIES